MTNKEALEILTKTDRVGVNLIFANDEETTKYNQDGAEALALAIEALKERRPTGRWISEDFDDWYCCSNCLKGDTYFDGLPNFCPYCGADMRGISDDTN